MQPQPEARFRDPPFWPLASLLALMIMAGSAPAMAAPSPIGRPAIERFAPDLDVYPANFAIAQDPAGIVYVGNADGVLSFDGARWRLHRTNTDQVARVLAHDGQRRLYVGGYNGFGYFETPIGPGSAYRDLTTLFGIEEADFDEVWQVEVVPEGVFFVTLEEVFRFDPSTGATARWKHPGRFGAMARIDGRLLLQYRGEGLREWRDGDFVPVAGSDGLAGQLYHLLALPEGGFVATARDGRWRRWRDGRVEEVSLGLPESSYFTAAEVLDSGLIALGAIDGWLYFLDPRGGSHDRFRLSHDWIADLHQTDDGGLLAQTDLETLYVRWPSKWSSWGPDHGLSGNVVETLQWQGRWLVIGNGGAYYESAPGSARFEVLAWTEFEAWDFEPLGDATGLVADSYTLKHVTADAVLQTLEGIDYPRRIVSSPSDPDLFWIGTEAGIGRVRRGPEGFVVEIPPDPDQPPFFSLVELAPDRLLAGAQGAGVFEVELQGDQLAYRPASDGIEFGARRFADVLKIDGRIHALTEEALWRRAGERFESVELAALGVLTGPERFVERFRQAADGTLWASDYSRVFRREAPGAWRELEVAPLLRGAITSIDFDAGGRVLIGASGSVAIFDERAPELPSARHQPILRSAELRRPGEPSRLLDPARAHEIAAGDHALRFEYALPGLHGRDEIRYQARLNGYEPEYTDWERTSHYTYFNLDPGYYVFEARARNPRGEILSMAPFEIRVVPPWHRQQWLLRLRWPATMALLAALVWLLMRARLWRLEGERRRLAEKVRERTEALVQANRKLKRMAELDELTGVANRRRFDDYLREQVDQCAESGVPLAMALVDLDRFKPYNDRHGHLAGDGVLRRIAETLRDGFGNGERLVARFGGDEFVAVLPGLDAEQARMLAERTRDLCAERCPEVQISIGIGVLPAGAQADAMALLEFADRQLYRVKEAGRNAVIVATLDAPAS